MVATDGQKLGDTTLTLYLTPGHTGHDFDADPGAGSRHTAPGGRMGPHGVQLYDQPRQTSRVLVRDLHRSAERFRDVVAKASADALVANHTNLDGFKTKLHALVARKPGDPNPYVIGANGVRRYLTVADEYTKAGLLHLK